MGSPIIVGKRGVVTLPAELRRRYRIDQGSVILVEEAEGGILLRPAVSMPVEVYSDERVREFLAEDRAGTARRPRPRARRR